MYQFKKHRITTKKVQEGNKQKKKWKQNKPKQVKIMFQEHLSIDPLHQKTVPNHESFIIAESSFVRRELHPKWTHNWNTTCVGLSE